MKRVTFGTGALLFGFIMMDSSKMRSKAKMSLINQQNLIYRFNKYFSFMNYKVNALCDDKDHAEVPYVGISIRSLIDKPGMTVLLVNSESPAAKGGVKVGDIIVRINGKDVNKIEDYYKAMGNVKTGDVIELTVERYYELKVVHVQV